jgi:hypothetical protein
MLTGRSLFAGESVAETLGKVLHEPIDDQDLPATTPRTLRQLIGRCLDRDPATRLRDIGEARIALGRLNEAIATGSPDQSPPWSRARVPFPAIAVGIALIALAGLAGWMLKPAPEDTEPTRKLDIITKNLVANLNPNSAPVLSPDGARLLYFADGNCACDRSTSSSLTNWPVLKGLATTRGRPTAGESRTSRKNRCGFRTSAALRPRRSAQRRRVWPGPEESRGTPQTK